MLFLFLSLSLLGATYSLSLRIPSFDADTVLGVLDRMPPWVAREFDDIRIMPSNELQEGSVRISVNASGHRLVEANSPVDALYGINSYLRQYCHSSVSWERSSFSNGCLKTKATLMWKAPKVRYFGNPCTFSYSFVWWKWEQWEKFIDWLALSGFNMVLAPVGQEIIWRELWKEIGISDTALDRHFTGPAFLAWHRMGNLVGWGGSLSNEFLKSQFELNKKIVDRLSKLGIVPVLPTFAGFVPEELAIMYPNLKMIRNKCWNSFNETYSCTYSLHPSEPLFQKISKIFIQKQQKYYGEVTHVYSADPFNEMSPEMNSKRSFGGNRLQNALREVRTTELVAQMASSIYEGCKAADEDCIWLLQSWMFHYDHWTMENAKAFLTAVPTGGLLVLDLYAEQHPLYGRTEEFFGHFFVWSMLHNFGGTTQMRGNLKHVNKAYQTALDTSQYMVGGGLTMEGINQNYIVYQFFIDRMWSQKNVETLPWLTTYIKSRYSTSLSAPVKMWSNVVATFYSEPLRAHDEKFDIFIYRRPQFRQRIKYWFDGDRIAKMAEMFVLLNSTFGKNANFRSDMNDIVREQLEYIIGNKLILRAYEAYGVNDNVSLMKTCAKIDSNFILLDQSTNYNVYDWIDDATDLAFTREEADQFESNARHQLTLWGPNAEVLDYGRKEWGGLINDYYRPRWNYFCETLLESTNVFNQKRFNSEVFEIVEKPFVMANHL